MQNETKNPASEEPLRLGIVGAGEITRILLPLLENSAVKVVALNDLHVEAARALAEQHGGIRVFADTSSMLACAEVEAVFVATPPSSHLPIFRAVLAAGKHLIGEKPWVMSEAEALELRTLADAHPGLLVASCSSRCRVLPAARRAAQLLAEGELGALHTLQMRATIRPPRPRSQLPAWKNTPGTTPGGVTADWGVYELEWLRGVLGPLFDPVSVHAVLGFRGAEGTPFDTSYQLTLRCRSGLDILVTRLAQVGPQDDRVELRGETAGLDLPMTPGSSLRHPILHRLNESGQLQSETLPETAGDWKDMLIGPLLDAAAAIREKRPPLADAASQIILHRVLDAVYLSHRGNRVVSLA